MGAWIEIKLFGKSFKRCESHPTMGAWIEIDASSPLEHVILCRTPRWVRGLKSFGPFISIPMNRVAPHDGCVDWNYPSVTHDKLKELSHPTMGAWIEILVYEIYNIISLVAPHDGCVDWNFHVYNKVMKLWCRTPRWVRGLKSYEWEHRPNWLAVAPHDGCVDWNSLATCEICFKCVAPHDGCVDWNFDMWYRTLHNVVAPHDGCVDWNSIAERPRCPKPPSRTPRWVRGLK